MPPTTPPTKAPGLPPPPPLRRGSRCDCRHRHLPPPPGALRRAARAFRRHRCSRPYGRGRDDFGQQRLVLQLVEVAALGIAAGGLPARDHGTGHLVELAGHLGVEAEAVEPALHVAALALVEADLVFGGLAGFLVKGGGIDAGGQVAGRGRRAVLQRGDPRQRQRLELAVRIVGQIGVELFRLVGFLDRAPELDFDLRILDVVGDRGRAGAGAAAVRGGRRRAD